MVRLGQPIPWAPRVEGTIMSAVRKLTTPVTAGYLPRSAIDIGPSRK
jgi:hypothetical protein